VDDFAFLHPAAAGPTRTGSLLDVEKAYIQQVLGECDWNITHAAEILDINRVTLHKKIKRYNLRNSD
jgi:two-component system response regulator HydG